MPSQYNPFSRLTTTFIIAISFYFILSCHIIIKFIHATDAPSSSVCNFGWGLNSASQLNSGLKAENVLSPVPINFPPLYQKNVSRIAAGGRHSIVLDSQGVAYAFGENGAACLGQGYEGGVLVPSPVLDNAYFNSLDIIDAYLGFQRTYLQSSDGIIYYFGVNDLGQVKQNYFSSPQIFPFSETHRVKQMSISKIHDSGLSPQHHTLILTESGEVFAFGTSLHGQCGDSSLVQYHPNRVNTSSVAPGLTFSHVSAGSAHSLIVSDDGLVVSFGLNDQSQLGFQTTSPNWRTPGLVNISAFASQAEAGDHHSLVLSSQGTVFAFGQHKYGQLGIGSQYPESVQDPTPIESGIWGGDRVTQISCGNIHSLILLSSGGVWSFGRNLHVESQISNSFLPVNIDPDNVLNGRIVIQISAGFVHDMLLCSNGDIITFGDNQFSSLGFGDRLHRPYLNFLSELWHPLAVDSMCAHQHFLYTDVSGKLFASGLNAHGQLGDQSQTTRMHIHSTSYGKSDIFTIACGQKHSLAIDSTGTLLSWGSNSEAQLGQSTSRQYLSTPTPLNILDYKFYGSVFVQVAAGHSFSLALSSAGVCISWGFNANGQLGVGDHVPRISPDYVYTGGALKGVNVVQISAGAAHSLVLSTEGKVFGFGSGLSLGIGTFNSQPKAVLVDTSPVLGDTPIIQISASHSNSMMLASDGRVVGCGINLSGELGLGFVSDFELFPVLVGAGHLEGIVISQIASTGMHSLLWSSTRKELYAMGQNKNFALGYDTSPLDYSAIPQRVPLKDSWIVNPDQVRIIAGESNSFLTTCEQTQCFGVHHLHPMVCSQNGRCTEENHCECVPNYSGPDCSVPWCGNLPASDDAVCHSHGNCIASNFCECHSDYFEDDCSLFFCSFVLSTSPGVCSGRGSCVNSNECECSMLASGENCQWNWWWVLGPLIGFLVLCVCTSVCVIIGGFVLVACSSVFRLKRVERQKQITQQLLEGFVKDIAMDTMDADSQRAKLIVQKSMLEIDFSELRNLEKIASGGSGAILFSAEWNESKVAVKVFKSGLMSGETFFQEFEHEVSLMSTLRHRNIINFYGCSLAFPRIAIVMELCEAGSIESSIKKGGLKKKSAHEILQMLLDIAEGMLYLHCREVIHRDLKCANVLVDEHSVCKLSDFGLSKYTKDNIERMHTVGIGTSYYMAPEIAKGTGQYTENVDVYAFGILAMEILLGRLCPFPGASQSNVMEVQQRAVVDAEYRPDVTELDSNFSFLHWMLKSCWNADPAMRPPARDIAKILKSSLYDTNES